jgi:sugar lactone lactonase YvrE
MALAPSPVSSGAYMTCTGSPNTAENFRIDIDDISFVGKGLSRPECVLCTRTGDIYASDANGGIAWLRPDGSQTRIGDSDLRPNGIALMNDGSFLIANHRDEGGVWRMTRDGNVRPFLIEIDGLQLPSVNFVYRDCWERIWICVSSLRPGDDQFRTDIRDGFVILVNDHGTRIVAGDLCWANECRLDASGNYFYVNETFGRRLVRFTVNRDGTLTDRHVVTTFGAGTYPDGLAVDAEGAFWVVSVGSNRLIRVLPDGRQLIVLEDSDAVHLERLEAALSTNTLTRPKLVEAKSQRLRNVTSIAFGGDDLRTAYLGCLSGDAIATFRLPVPGLPPAHWNNTV